MPNKKRSKKLSSSSYLDDVEFSTHDFFEYGTLNKPNVSQSVENYYYPADFTLVEFKDL